MIFLSSDYVFDGTKGAPYEISDSRHPINVYGETKARAEEQLLEILPDVCIVRTSWLFGHGGKCFPATILKLATPKAENAAPQLSVVNDQRGSPTFTRDLASAIAQLCKQGTRGIIHATNSGDCSWYEFAREIVRISGLPATVKPVTTAEFAAAGTPARLLGPLTYELACPRNSDASLAGCTATISDNAAKMSGISYSQTA